MLRDSISLPPPCRPIDGRSPFSRMIRSEYRPIAEDFPKIDEIRMDPDRTNHFLGATADGGTSKTKIALARAIGSSPSRKV